MRTCISLFAAAMVAGSPALADMMAGRVHLMFDNLASALPSIKGGKVRALAVTTKARTSFLPELPTLDESGLKGFDMNQEMVARSLGASPARPG